MSKANSNTGREARVEIIVGVFVALILTALGIFTIVVSGASLFGGGTSVIEVVLPDAMGLRRNDPVIARGTSVGTVSDVHYDQDGVHVEAHTGRVVELLLRQGHLWGAREVVIPAGLVAAYEDGLVRLTVDTAAIGALPSV